MQKPEVVIMQKSNENLEAIPKETFFVGDLEISRDEQEVLNRTRQRHDQDVIVREDYFLETY